MPFMSTNIPILSPLCHLKLTLRTLMRQSGSILRLVATPMTPESLRRACLLSSSLIIARFLLSIGFKSSVSPTIQKNNFFFSLSSSYFFIYPKNIYLYHRLNTCKMGLIPVEFNNNYRFHLSLSNSIVPSKYWYLYV